MRFFLSVDAETPQEGRFYVTVHREGCPHVEGDEPGDDRRYWDRRPMRDLDAVHVYVEDQIARIRSRYQKDLERKDCASCKPGEDR